MKIKRAFYKKIWFWVACTICFLMVLGSYHNINQYRANNIKGSIVEYNNDEVYIHFIDVGQADCIFIDAGDVDILIDAGNRADSDLVVDYLKKLNTDDIELIIATHPHEDHIGGMVEVINNFSIDLILKPGISSIETKTSVNFENSIAKHKISTKIPSFSEQFVFGDLIITILSDKSNLYNETNDFSIVCRVDYFDNSFIFTGDAESPVEHDILDSGINIDADVLKIGHHGGATSTTALFLNKISPSYAVISVGEDNKYGHPDKIITKRLELNKIDILRTDILGNIIIKTDGMNLQVLTDNEKKIIEKDKTPVEYNVEIISLDKKAERVVIKNNENEAIDLSGWYLLSAKGEQIFYFPTNYKLEKNQTIEIVGYSVKDTGDFNWEEGGGIWNNTADDDAKLFDNNKNLVSFYDDGM